MIKIRIILVVLSFISFLSCNPEESALENLNVLSITIDGSNISEDVNGVGTTPSIAITFDASINIDKFEEELVILPSEHNTQVNISYSNSNSKANLSLELEPNSNYTLQVPASEIGANGQKLTATVNIELNTEASIASACTSTSEACAGQLIFANEGTDYTLDYYSTYPLNGLGETDQIKNAIILVHGANRNNDDYFNWMNSTLTNLSLQSNTILIAPQFKDDSEVTDESELYWNSNNWRDGDDSGNDHKVSSFTAIDSIVSKLVDNYDLNEIIITGHSSGGLFTHVYGAANMVESSILNGPKMEYLVANSQYFYYPTGERVNEETDQFFVPTNCSGYDFWPLGFNVTPPYVSRYSELEFNNQFLNRDIHYLLGNGNDSDPSLNTDGCRTTLLGSSRYKRGENIFYYIQNKFPENNHKRTIVNGIGHNGEAMYKSEEFKNYIKDLFSN